VTIGTTLRITYDHNPSGQPAETNDALLAVVSPGILKFKGDTLKDNCGIGEVQAPFSQSIGSFHRVEGDSHEVIVYTLTSGYKRPDIL
jgi:hypothetical protein